MATTSALLPTSRWTSAGLVLSVLLLDIAVRVLEEPLPARCVIAASAIAIAYWTGIVGTKLGFSGRPRRASFWMAGLFLAAELALAGLRWPMYWLGLTPSLSLLGGALWLIGGTAFVEQCHRSLIAGVLMGGARPWARIVVAGVLGAAIQVVHGNWSVEDLCGSFALAWVFVSTRSAWLSLTIQIIASSVDWGIHFVAWWTCGSCVT